MNEETLLTQCDQIIGEAATEIARLYLESWNIINVYMGQVSAAQQLALFKPLALELTVFTIHLLHRHHPALATTLCSDTEALAQESVPDGKAFVQERLLTYAKSQDPATDLYQFCQKAAKADELKPKHPKRPTPPSLNDRPFIAIQETAARLEHLLES
jgi:hypothetical protein